MIYLKKVYNREILPNKTDFKRQKITITFKLDCNEELSLTVSSSFEAKDISLCFRDNKKAPLKFFKFFKSNNHIKSKVTRFTNASNIIELTSFKKNNFANFF